ncbi:MAG: YARHG domain-containing protein [Lachnospiraceae bacterium]|nr:YARHG domain-containing protein [Lachnospiraceae bacterium]
MFCSKCGSKLPDNAKFCQKCGAPVSAGPQQSSDETTQILPPDAGAPVPVVTGVTGSSASNQPVITSPAPKKKEKAGKKSPIVIILLVLALIAVLLVGVVGGMFLVGSGGFAEAREILKDEGISGVFDVITGHYRENPHIGGHFVDDDDDEEEEDDDREEAEEADAGEGEQPETTPAVEPEEKNPVTITVRQVDNANFPHVTFYATVCDENGEVVKNLQKDDFSVNEIMSDGSLMQVGVDRVYQVMDSGKINIDMVMDKSGSMSGSSRMDKAKAAANAFINTVAAGDQMEIISFDSFVYLEQGFSSNLFDAERAVNGLTPSGQTALFDALYAALLDTFEQEGAKCVIAFTDGEENSSNHSYQDVLDLAVSTGIPVFLIGFGEAYHYDVLQRLAEACSGEFYSVDEVNMETLMEEIYTTIYREQQNYYVFDYTSKDSVNIDSARTIELTMSENSRFTGSYRKAYEPVPDIYGGFSAEYWDMDYMIPDSDVREVTEADLSGMSLAQLRIARNEVFARHGRQFKDNKLNEWFYSKNWYLSLSEKYTPADFDAIKPSPLSKLEIANVTFIKNYEDDLMATSLIYPDASRIKLTEYDLALSKPVLKKALEQMKTMTDTSILQSNMTLVETAINAQDITY